MKKTNFVLVFIGGICSLSGLWMAKGRTDIYAFFGIVFFLIGLYLMYRAREK